MAKYNILPLALGTDYHVLAKQSELLIPPLRSAGISLDVGKMETGSSLDGAYWLGKIDVDVFSADAALSCSGTFSGFSQEAGRFSLGTDLPSESPGLHIQDAGLPLSAEIKADPLRAHPLPRFILSADLDTSGVASGKFQDAGRFELNGGMGEVSAGIYPNAGRFELGGDIGEVSAEELLPDIFISASLPALTGYLSAKVSGVAVSGDLPAIRGDGLFLGATLAAELPLFAGSMAVHVQCKADIAASLPSLTGLMHAGGRISSSMSALSGEVSAMVHSNGFVLASFPKMTCSMNGKVPVLAEILFTMRGLSGEMTGAVDVPARLEVTMPRLYGEISALTEVGVLISGSLFMVEALSGKISGGEKVDHKIMGTQPAFTGVVYANVPQSTGVLRYVRS